MKVASRLILLNLFFLALSITPGLAIQEEPNKDPVTQFNDISRMSDSDSVLLPLAEDMFLTKNDARAVLARMKLAAKEPLIQSRLPGLLCTGWAAKVSNQYMGGLVDGERITINFQQGNKVLAQKEWKSEFPDVIYSHEFRPASVNGSDLLKELFALPAFSERDMIELFRSKIPEVRIGAIGMISNQAVLAGIARENVGPKWEMRRAALEKLNDQAVLIEVAKKDLVGMVREDAIRKVDDQQVLADIAQRDENRDIRVAAVKRLTNQSILARIGRADKDVYVREAVAQSLNDQGELLRIARTDKWFGVRQEATKRLTDIAALKEIAEKDEDPFVREAAKKRIEELNK